MLPSVIDAVSTLRVVSCTSCAALETHTPAYVLWFGPTGLTIARALGRMGVPVIAVHDDEREPCLDTRYARRVQVLPRMDVDEQSWLDWLMREGRSNAPEKAVLFPASDECWLFMVRHRDALREYFHFALPDAPDLEQWPTKPWQEQAAERAGITHPRSHPVNSMDDLERAAEMVRYPCLVKPRMSFEWVKRRAHKLEFAQDRASLITLGSAALVQGLSFFLQEYVPGDDNAIHGLFAAIGAGGNLLGMCVSRKIRQFCPRFGSSCISVSVEQPRVTQLGLQLLRTIGFRGIASVEFKQDARDHEFRFIEINLRPPLMMGVAIDSGVNLPYLVYCDVLGLPLPAMRVRLGRRVGLLEKDLHSAKFYRKIGRLTRRRWLTQWLRTRDLHFAWDDLGPFRGYAHTLWDHYRRGDYRDVPDFFPTLDEWQAGEWQGVHEQLAGAEVEASHEMAR